MWCERWEWQAGLRLAVLVLVCLAGGARADECPKTQAMSLDAFMGGGFAAGKALQVRIPADYGHVDPSGLHPASTLWTTLENAANARRNGGPGVADFFYGGPAPDVTFDPDRLMFLDRNGRFLDRIVAAQDGAKVELVKAAEHVFLFAEAPIGGPGTRAYVVYVALADSATVVRIGYRPPAGQNALGDCVWQAFRSAIAPHAVRFTAYSPVTTEALVAGHADWSKDVAECPVDLLGRTSPVQPGDDACAFTDGNACLARCEAGDANACYWLGRDMVVRDQEEAGSILLARACRSGIVDACTQRAVEISSQPEGTSALSRCVYRTLENTCLLGDPWGCALQGARLLKGAGTERDPAGASRAFDRACALEPAGKACASTRRIRASMEAPASP